MKTVFFKLFTCYLLLMSPAFTATTSDNTTDKKTNKNKIFIYGAKLPATFPVTIIKDKQSQVPNTLLANDNKVYLLDFWATWCGPCIASFPKLNSIQKKYAGKVQIIGISVDSGKKAPTALANKRTDLLFPLVYGGKENTAFYNQWVVNGFKISSIPTIIVIKNGRIIAKALVGAITDAFLSKVISKDFDISKFTNGKAVEQEESLRSSSWFTNKEYPKIAALAKKKMAASKYPVKVQQWLNLYLASIAYGFDLEAIQNHWQSLKTDMEKYDFSQFCLLLLTTTEKLFNNRGKIVNIADHTARINKLKQYAKKKNSLFKMMHKYVSNPALRKKVTAENFAETMPLINTIPRIKNIFFTNLYHQIILLRADIFAHTITEEASLAEIKKLKAIISNRNLIKQHTNNIRLIIPDFLTLRNLAGTMHLYQNKPINVGKQAYSRYVTDLFVKANKK